MKALLYIMVLAMFLVSSCATSGFHMGGEYDDLYYSSTDNAVVSNPVTTTTNTSTVTPTPAPPTANPTQPVGWVKADNVWRYYNTDRTMKTGWFNDNGTWYYLNADGSMASNTVIDGYTLDASGAWIN